jgi:hypothetical protein
MIHIFFVPGTFGSTVEYVLRSFTKEKNNGLEVKILEDGSMHSYEKEMHLTKVSDFELFFKNYDSSAISTIMYPFVDLHLPELLSISKKYIHDNDCCILIYLDSIENAELNMLFQYHKIAFGKKINRGLEIFCNENKENISKWNESYTHWTQMRQWELREWLSLFYVNWVEEWINSQWQVPDKFLKISASKILHDTENTFNQIISFCKLTKNESNLNKFVSEWQKKQQYIYREYQLIDQIVNFTLDQIPFSWDSVNIIAEAIIQQRLRARGYEIRCDGLDCFPTNSSDLFSLLEFRSTKE